MTTSAMQLTRQQINFFETFGYLVLPGLLAELIPDISRRFDALFERHQAEVIDWRHEAHYMQSRKVLMQFIERENHMAALLDDPRIDGLFTSLLGEDYLYRASEGNIFSGDTYWHSDLYGANFKYRHVKILMYLEALDPGNGAFQAIPGSHLFGDRFANEVDRLVWKHEQHLGLKKHEVPGVTIPTQPGDVLIFDYRLKHATSNTRQPRRMFSICASQAFQQADLPSLQKIAQDFISISRCEKVYQAGFVETSPPSRMRHLQQYLQAEAALQAGGSR